MAKKDTYPILLLYMPEQGEAGCIQLWHERMNYAWVECRGNPFSTWTEQDVNTPMYQLHAVMEGWHVTVLHQDQILALHDKHPDYYQVLKFLEE